MHPDHMPNDKWKAFISENIAMDQKGMSAAMRENFLKATHGVLDAAPDEQATRLSTRLRNLLRR